MKYIFKTSNNTKRRKENWNFWMESLSKLWISSRLNEALRPDGTHTESVDNLLLESTETHTKCGIHWQFNFRELLLQKAFIQNVVIYVLRFRKDFFVWHAFLVLCVHPLYIQVFDSWVKPHPPIKNSELIRHAAEM